MIESVSGRRRVWHQVDAAGELIEDRKQNRVERLVTRRVKVVRQQI
jgi:hypothetical protein